jgi:hypothetical protein
MSNPGSSCRHLVMAVVVKLTVAGELMTTPARLETLTV